MYSFRADLTSGEADFSAVVCELEEGDSLADLFEELYHSRGISQPRADFIIVRPSVKYQIQPSDIRSAQNEADEGNVPEALHFLVRALVSPGKSFARVLDRPIYILSSHDYSPFISENINPGTKWDPIRVGDLSESEALIQLQDRELGHLVEYGSAILPPVPGALYRSPSRRPMKQFLRAGNIQRSRSCLDALFFWLLPHLRGCSGLVCDTWSISSLALNISRRLQAYQDDPHDHPCPVEMLDRYHDGSDALAAEASSLIWKLYLRAVDWSNAGEVNIGDRKVVFLVSVTHTGRLVERLRKSLLDREIGSDEVTFVALFKIGNEAGDLPCLKRLQADDFDIEPDDSLDEIVIDDHLYFPISFRDHELVIREKNAEANKSFFQLYQDEGVFRTHRDHRDDGVPRHHAIWLDTPKLVENEAFERRFRNQVADLSPRPGLIIAPKHVAARIMMRVAADELGNGVKTYEYGSLHIAENDGSDLYENLEAMGQNGSILVLDDVLITGRRLSTYLAQLRGHFFGRIHFLVGVARTSSIGEWERMQKRLRHRRLKDGSTTNEKHTVSSVEVLILPNWDETLCPWCRETRLLRSILGSGALPASLEKRLTFLQENLSVGLMSNLFLGAGIPPLTPGSIFVRETADEPSIFAAVAAAVQDLRTNRAVNDTCLERPKFPIRTVLTPEEYLVHTYTDAILRASLLRSAFPHELVMSTDAREQQRTAQTKILIESDDPKTSCITDELLLAAAQQKFPKLSEAIGSKPFRSTNSDLLSLSWSV